MIVIDLRTLLQMSTSQRRPMSGQKRVGNSRYTVHYELQGPKLTIRQVKRIKKAASDKQRRRPQRRILRHALHAVPWCYNSSSQTDVDLCNLVDGCSQTDEKRCNLVNGGSQTDAKSCSLVNGYSQTDEKPCNLVNGYTQTAVEVCHSVNNYSQTDVDLCNLMDGCSQTDAKPCNLVTGGSQTDAKSCNLVNDGSQTDEKPCNMVNGYTQTAVEVCHSVNNCSQTNLDLCNLMDGYSQTDAKSCNLVNDASQTDEKPCNLVSASTQTAVKVCQSVNNCSQTEVNQSQLVHGCSQTEEKRCNLVNDCTQTIVELRQSVNNCSQTDATYCRLVSNCSQTDATQCSLANSCSQTLQPEYCDAYVETKDLLMTASTLDGCIQAVEPTYGQAQLDVFGPTLKYSSKQQTVVKYFDENAIQLDHQPMYSQGTSMNLELKSCSTQVSRCNSCLGTQTEPNCNNVELQTISDCRNNATQTIPAEEEPIQHYESLLMSILNTLYGQHRLLQGGVQSINQLLELQTANMLIKRQVGALVRLQKQQEAAQRESELETEQESEQQGHMQIELIGDSNQLQAQLSAGKQRYHIWKYRHNSSWKCTLKCKGCGLHMHRTRYRVSTELFHSDFGLQLLQ